MNSSERILQFLDGTLSNDEEAEFLHILSVSPERRELLRSFMHQREYFARDKNAISVPYAAEQKLWQRLGAAIPVAEASEVAAPLASGVASAGMLERIGTPFLVTIAATLLTLGIGIGYSVGNTNSSSVVRETRWVERPTTSASTSEQRIPRSMNASRPRVAYTRFSGSELRVFTLGSTNGMQELSAMLLASMHSTNSIASITPKREVAPASASQSEASGTTNFSFVSVRTLHSKYAVGGERTNPPHLYAESVDAPQRSILQRFEFSFLESFGRELPSSFANNVSMPILTNAAASVFFQVLPNSDALWVGVSGGAANFSRKHLTTEAGDPGDPLQQQMVAVYSHTPANWIGGFLQYRLPLFGQTDLTMTGGYGASSIGTLGMGELGLRYDATRDVGFTVGLRAVELSYNLASEEAATLKSVRGPLVVPNGVASSTPSYNVEINTGLFFHF